MGGPPELIIGAGKATNAERQQTAGGSVFAGDGSVLQRLRQNALQHVSMRAFILALTLTLTMTLTLALALTLTLTRTLPFCSHRI